MRKKGALLSVSASNGPLSGARFYRCALQVNPFAYVVRHRMKTAFNTEEDYNAAIVEACVQQGIEAVAVTDHYRVRTATGLLALARSKGIHAFPGFEAVTKEGVHLLGLFDLDADLDELDRILGNCGILDTDEKSPTGKYDVLDFLEESRKWGSVCVAAHVASSGGLLRKLSGRSRANAWRSPSLLACSLSGSAGDAPDDLRSILRNEDPAYRRERPIAVVNAKDVSAPSSLSDPGATCRIKMSGVGLEGLRQAFLDPESRIRLNSDAEVEPHARLVALSWQGGFLDRQSIHFNPDLNVLVGGRGAGKSTVVESIRYALGLEPIGEDSHKAHTGIVRQVLRDGTRVALQVESRSPSRREYRIERTVPNPPVVRSDGGIVSNLLPGEVLPGIEVFGQHEIAELSKSQESLTALLDRFVKPDPSFNQRKADLRNSLEKVRRSILDVQSELRGIRERLADLPRLEERVARFREAGIEGRLRERSLLVREEQVLDSISERLGPFDEILRNLRQELPIDRVFLSPRALRDLPGKEILDGANDVLASLSGELDRLADEAGKAIEQAETGIAEVRSRWDRRRREVEDAYERILRGLGRSAVEGGEFIRIRKDIERLRPLRERESQLERGEAEHQTRRRDLLVEWEDLKAENHRRLERAAKRVSRTLRDRVRIEVTASADRQPLLDLLRTRVGGRLDAVKAALEKAEAFSLPRFVDCCRQGAEALRDAYSITPSQAERLAAASPEVLMELEELDLTPSTTIRLNTALSGDPPCWQRLGDLSKGQKATAVLLLLLLDSDAPLIVDQPEDDLDNRFITDGVVPRVRQAKRDRQFVFSTHNANIPVLGDAELILGLTPSGEAANGTAEIRREHMGGIDERPVRELVEELLEGGRAAFETRRLKYGF